MRARKSSRQRLRDWKDAFNASLTPELDAPGMERRARAYLDWLDHGILRYLWRNEAVVAPGLIRANHPGRARLARFAARGGKTVLSLRGGTDTAPHLLESKDCARLGLTLKTVPLQARIAPEPEQLLALIEAFRTIERPVLMHCKSGADRTSLAAAIYLLEFEGASVAEARRQLSPRFIHFKWTKTGVLDRFIDFYEARLQRGPIRLSDWIATEYDPQAVAVSFAADRQHMAPVEPAGD